MSTLHAQENYFQKIKLISTKQAPLVLPHTLTSVRQLLDLQGFDPAYYVAQYPDVALSDMDPLLHFVRCGVHEGRNPAPWFNTAFYLAQNPDVASSGMNPFLHYLLHGKAEGRLPAPKTT